MTEPMARVKSLYPFFLAVIVIVPLALLAYANTFNVPFIYDDINNILANTHIRMTAVTIEDIAAVFNSPSAKRPFANLTLALNYYLNRYQVGGYHLINLLTHIVTALLIYLVSGQTLRLCGKKSNLAPILASSLWLVNPVNTQSVTYIIQRMNSLATMFYMLTLFLYIQARKTGMAGRASMGRYIFYVFCLLAGLCGLASKEIVATLPLMIFLYEWYFFQRLDIPWLKRKLPWIALIMGLVLVPAAFYLGPGPLEKILSAYAKHNFTPVQRLLTEPAVIIYYIGLLLFPHPDRLTLIYDFPVFTSPVDPLTALAGILGIAAMVVAGFSLSSRQPLLSFAVFWFLGNLMIESSVFGLALIFEHRTYLPSVFPVIALSALFLGSAKTSKPALAVCLLLVVTGLVWTHQRNAVWDGDIRLWQDNAAKAPAMPQVHNNLGQALLKNGQTELAETVFRRALALDPGLDEPRVNLGVALQRQGRIGPAKAQYQTVLDANPDHVKARFNLALALKEQGQTEAAARHLEKIMAVDPGNTGVMLSLGAALMEQDKNDQALAWFRKALAIDATDSRIINNLGIVLQRLGRIDEALAAYYQGLALDPDNARLHNGLGLALLDRGQYEEAARHFLRALAVDPGLTEAYVNLGVTAEHQGEIARAVAFYRQALEIDPSYDLARWNLALLYIKEGRTDEAAALTGEAAVIKPEQRPFINRLILALAEQQALAPALELAEKLTAALPDDPLIHYNLACLHARLDHPEEALVHLRSAVDLGYDRWDHLRADPDLKNIHHTEYFMHLAGGRTP